MFPLPRGIRQTVCLIIKDEKKNPYHAGKHGAQAPHVERVVVFLEINKQLGALEVTRCDTDIVLCSRVVEFCETPVDQTKLEVKLRKMIVSNEYFRASLINFPSYRISPWHEKSTWPTYLALLVFDHDIVGLDISVHNALGVAKVQSLLRIFAHDQDKHIN